MIRRLATSLLALACALPLPRAAAADTALPAVVQETLPNGLRVLILERRFSPTVAFRVFFDVGAVDNLPGKTGLAHLFEHMVFKGTKSLGSKDYSKEKPLLDKVEAAAQALIQEETKPAPDPERVKALREALGKAHEAADEWMEKDEYEKLMQGAGGEHFNAHTASDYTSYEISLPANRMELWMATESDRFKNPVLREFYRERDVVMEERRRGYESHPSGKLWENFITHAFVAHPYHNEGIGWMDNLKKLTAQDARDFFASRYGPNSAVAVIVGDVDASKTLAMMHRYFDSVPAAKLAEQRITKEPPQDGERRIEVRFEAEPLTYIGWHKPDLRHPDQPAYEMLTSLLSDGRTSRLYKALVEGKQVVQSVDADINWPGNKYPGLMIIDMTPRAPHTPAAAEKALYAELEAIKTGPIADEELAKVRNQLEVGLIRKMESNEGMAEQLGFYETVAGDWRYPWKLKDALARITAADVQRVAKQLFRKENRTVATLLPPEAPKGAAK